MDRKLSELNNLNGNAYSRSDCMYLEIGFEKTPKVLRPGNNDIRDKIKELADEEECANTTTLL